MVHEKEGGGREEAKGLTSMKVWISLRTESVFRRDGYQVRWVSSEGRRKSAPSSERSASSSKRTSPASAAVGEEVLVDDGCE
jgi:hypothetical protein